MAVRTFNRRFRNETGLTPGTWLIQQRVRHAQRILESSDLPIEDVAAQAGFGPSLRCARHSMPNPRVAAYQRPASNSSGVRSQATTEAPSRTAGSEAFPRPEPRAGRTQF
jgi:transcriptional regulator GlxA family with amidase domain